MRGANLSKTALLIILSIAIIAPLMINVVHAGTGTANTVGQVWLDAQQNDPTGQYCISQASVGQTVYIYWGHITPPSGTVKIVVTPYDEDGNALTPIQLGILSPSASGTTAASFVVPNTPNGYCDVSLYGQATKKATLRVVASVTLFVLPESTFGTLAALGAGLAAFAVYKKRNSLPHLYRA